MKEEQRLCMSIVGLIHKAGGRGGHYLENSRKIGIYGFHL